MKGVVDNVTCVVGATGSITLDVSSMFSDGDTITDYYTGNKATVSDGKVTFTAGTNGVILLESNSKKPAVNASPASGDYYKKVSEGLEIKLVVGNADKGEYSINGGEKISYKNGDKITIGRGEEFGSTTTVELFASNDEGETIKLTAKAKNGTSPYTYTFKANGKTLDSDGNTCSWNPSKGNYKVEVTVTDADGNKATSNTIEYDIRNVNNFKIDKFTVNPSTVKVGQTVTLSASTINENGSVQYKFVAKKNNKETMIKDYSTSDMYSASANYKNVVFPKNNLKAETHSIKIEYTGMRNSNATGSLIIDAFDIIDGNII